MYNAHTYLGSFCIKQIQLLKFTGLGSMYKYRGRHLLRALLQTKYPWKACRRRDLAGPELISRIDWIEIRLWKKKGPREENRREGILKGPVRQWPSPNGLEGQQGCVYWKLQVRDGPRIPLQPVQQGWQEPMPCCVKHYNAGMGGVGLLGYLVDCYRIAFRKIGRYYHKLFLIYISISSMSWESFFPANYFHNKTIKKP